eukprot:31385-Eustigmatos_ZCMA.PRE.1
MVQQTYLVAWWCDGDCSDAFGPGARSRMTYVSPMLFHGHRYLLGHERVCQASPAWGLPPSVT